MAVLGNGEVKERSLNLVKGNASLRREVNELYETVVEGFQAQSERTRNIRECWDLWNCKLGPKQQFAGRNRLYAPIIYEAVKARVTRVVNDLFPQSGRHVEAISQDGTLPRAVLSAAESYIEQMGLRTAVQAMCLNGDIEGQYNVYISWQDSSKEVTYRTNRPVEMGGLLAGMAEDIETETELSGCPRAEVLSDVDVLVFPATSSCIEEALSSGGGVAIIRRWTKRQIKDMIVQGAIDKTEGDKLLSELSSFQGDKDGTAEEKLHSAGIKRDAAGKWVLVYEVWTELELEDGEFKLCQLFLAGKYKHLMVRRNPLWCDLCPLISVPVEPVAGVAKGITPVTAVKQLQYFANDVLNEGADSATYSLLPIILRDPAYQTSPLILAPAAVWDVPPNSIQFAEFPPLWQYAIQIVGNLKAEIFQVLSVNPAMITQGEAKKPTQAEVAQEQQVDILSTNDKTALVAGSVLNKILTLIMGLDYQYRDHVLFVRAYGEMGMQVNMEQVPPFEQYTRYSYKWIGQEVTRSAQQMQEKIAALNIIKAIPPQMYPAYQLDLQPFILDLTESVFGPRLGRLVLKDMRSQMSVDPTIENGLMQIGHYTPVHPMDDTQQHMQVHQQAMQEGDPFGMIAQHLIEHEMVFAQMQQQAMQAVTGAQGPGSGQEGSPEGLMPGAQPGTMDNANAPPGAIHPDMMRDPSVMPPLQ